jgi:hypothetical protein
MEWVVKVGDAKADGMSTNARNICTNNKTAGNKYLTLTVVFFTLCISNRFTIPLLYGYAMS